MDWRVDREREHHKPPFEQWGGIFTDDVVVAAILDRLLHHSYPFLIKCRAQRNPWPAYERQSQ
jgi:hypothetical protein